MIPVMHRHTTAIRRAPFGVALLACSIAASCASDGPRQTGRAEPTPALAGPAPIARPAGAAVVFQGRPAVLGVNDLPADVVRALGDGEAAISAEGVTLLGARLGSASAVRNAATAWLGPALAIDVAPWTPETAQGGWSPLVMIEPGDDAPSTITFDGAPLALDWREPPEPPARAASSPPDAVLSAMLARLAMDPADAWRAVLVAERLGLAPPPAPSAMAPALAGAGEMLLLRWRAAIARLESIDASLAGSVLDSLTRTVRLGHAARTSAVAPAWSEDRAALGELLARLLDRSASDESVRTQAESWLSRRATFVAWVLNDGGAGTPAVIAAANLTGAPEAITATLPAGVDLQPAGAFESVALRPPRAPEGAERVESVRVSAGRSTVATTLSPVLRASPPGLTIGPLLPDQSLSVWLGEAPPLAEPAWAAAGVLQREPSGRWAIYLECAGDPAGGDDRVLIRWSALDGAQGAGTVAVRRSMSVEGAPPGFRVNDQGPRWTAYVPLPAQWEDVAIVAIGLERIDGRGVRTTWPRQPLPWDEMTARAPISLRAWDGR